MTSNSRDVIRLVGYWNGSEDNPEIVFKPFEDSEKQNNYTLVVLEISEPFETDISVKSKQLEKKLANLYSNKANKKLNEVNSSLKKLNKITKRFK